MRSFCVVAIAGIGAMLLQTTIFPAVPFLPIVPDLILVLAVYLGVRHPGVGGAVGAFLLGYFLDTFSGTFLGVQAFALTAVYAGISLIARHLWMEQGAPLIAAVFVGACLRNLALAAVAGLVAARAPVWQHVLRYGFLEAVAAALLAPTVFAFLAWERRLVGLS
jgi:rod shape-determining protein MreD